MRESRTYLNFFIRNAWLLLVPSLAFLVMGFIYQSHQYVRYSDSRILSMGYTEANISDRIALTDQAVALTRVLHNRNLLALGSNINLTVFKNAPLMITLKVESINPEQLKASLDKVQQFLDPRFPLLQQGNDMSGVSYPSLYFGLLVGLFIGLTLGLLIALIKDYFRFF